LSEQFEYPTKNDHLWASALVARTAAKMPGHLTSMIGRKRLRNVPDMKIARANRAKLHFSIVKYADL